MKKKIGWYWVKFNEPDAEWQCAYCIDGKNWYVWAESSPFKPSDFKRIYPIRIKNPTELKK